jgi:hypothetical protein
MGGLLRGSAGVVDSVMVRCIFGSTSSKILRLSFCPILLVFANDPLPPPEWEVASQVGSFGSNASWLACACRFYGFPNFFIISRNKFDGKIQQFGFRVSMLLIHPHSLLKPFEFLH